jgi:hypothetical protein
MNIFFLDRDPKLAAKYHCDQHVVKMAIEYAQLLSTALVLTGSTTNEYVYKATHSNHPCALWARSSFEHWKWLWLLGHHVGNEYTKRYGKIHKSTRVLRNLPVPNNIADFGWHDPPQAMPDEYKDDDTVKAYRDYYLCDKSRFCRWNHSSTPYWWEEKACTHTIHT